MKLHLGCGNSPKPAWINIDSRPLPGVDIVRDVLRGIPFAADSIDEIYSENFLEHVPQTECIWIMNEMWRVLKPGGISHHLIPEAGSINFYQDPTHLSHWHRETLTYFTLGHGRNKYYGGDIKPWLVTWTLTEPNKLLDVTFKKPE